MRRATRDWRPMVSAEFGYSGLGAVAALSVALTLVALLYAFIQWPLDTAGWLAAATAVRIAGRHPLAALFR